MSKVNGLFGVGLGVNEEYQKYISHVLSSGDKTYWVIKNDGKTIGVEGELGLIFDMGKINLNVGFTTIMFYRFDVFFGIGLSL